MVGIFRSKRVALAFASVLLFAVGTIGYTKVQSSAVTVIHTH
jgi:hypothetical protein